MDPDRRNLLRNFDDPPTTWRGLLAGVAVLFAVLAGLASWDLVVAALQLLSDALLPAQTR